MTEQELKEVNETDLEEVAGGRSPGKAPMPIEDSDARDISAAGTARPVGGGAGGSPSSVGDDDLSNISAGMSRPGAEGDSPSALGDDDLKNVSAGMSAGQTGDIKVKVNDADLGDA